jgi:F-type H+-transporting ATPase subunit a
MFFSLAAVAVGEHFYWTVAGFTVHGQVLLVTWLVIFIILTIAVLGTRNIEQGFDKSVGDQLVLSRSESQMADFDKLLTEKLKKFDVIPEQRRPIVEDLYQENIDDRFHRVVNVGPYFTMLHQGPTGLRNFVELVFEYLVGIAKDQLGEYEYRPWVPFTGTIFLFIFVANWLGALVPWKLIQLPEGELAAPTNDINTTVALALLTSVSYFYAGFKGKGLEFFTRYISPSPVFLPINILEDFSKPLSLSFRLFGNVVADEIVVSVLCLLVPLFVPLPVMVLGIFASSVQALVFSTLAASYIAESIE